MPEGAATSCSAWLSASLPGASSRPDSQRGLRIQVSGKPGASDRDQLLVLPGARDGCGAPLALHRWPC